MEDSFWQNVETCKLVEEKRKQLLEIERMRNEYIALSHIVLNRYKKESVDAASALVKFKEYSAALQDYDNG